MSIHKKKCVEGFRTKKSTCAVERAVMASETGFIA
jgi:hypothetical protein